jgi:hypothetical protein
LTHWELAEPVFCSEELSCLLYKKPKPKPNSGSLAEKFKFVFQIQVLAAVLALVCHFSMSILSNFKVEKVLKGSLDLIPSPSPSVKIQIIGGKV